MGTDEAIACLLDEWLFDEGEALESAFTVCLLAREGRVEHDMARAAFINAAHEAAIYVVPESMAIPVDEWASPRGEAPVRWRRKQQLEKN